MTQSSATPPVSIGYVQMMARYNAEMNRRIFAAAARLSDQERRAQRGAFWGSIHGTLCHSLWGDQIWMSRFNGWTKPAIAQKDSASLIATFDELQELRVKADAGISQWASRMRDGWLQEDQSWFSLSAGRELRTPRGVLIAHFFNHQTHHRGQVHAMITAAGEQTGDTDLFLLV
jgi:uncharacterized damage-inducible protein DinB